MRPSFYRPLSACALALLCSVAPRVGSAQSSEFNLHFNTRSIPVVRARITLETNAPLTPATIIKITDGPSTLDLPRDDNVHEFAPGGDQFSTSIFDQANPTSVEITVERPTVGGNPCELNKDNDMTAGGVAEEKNYKITLAGVTGYYVTSFSAPAFLVDTNGGGVLEQKGFCGCVNRRVSTAAATLVHVGGNAADRGRHRLDAVLVLDKSGSMSDPLPVSQNPQTPSSKWALLADSLQQFIGLWEVNGMNPSPEMTNDRLGIVFFASDVQPPAGLTPRSMGWDALKNAVNHPTGPGGSTALRGGLAAGLNAVTGTTHEDKTLVLMSDGMQNVGPLISPLSTENVLGLPLTDGGSPVSLRAQCTPVVTLAMGIGSDINGELLAQIAEETGVTTKITPTDDLVASGFASALVDALKGNTLSTLAREKGEILQGDSAPVTLDIDGTIDHVIAVLSWPDGRRAVGNLGLPYLTVRGEGSEWNFAPTRKMDGDSHEILRFDISAASGPVGSASPTAPGVLKGHDLRPGVPASGSSHRSPAGRWQFRVHRGAVLGQLPDPRFMAQPAPTPKAVPYQLAIYAEEKSLDFRLQFIEARHRTGEPLRLVAEVGLNNKPIAAAGAELAVRVETPNGALGTELHLRDDPGGPAVDPDQASSPYQKKLRNLLRDSDFLAKTGTKLAASPLSLTPRGPGQFFVELSDTKLPGTYRFHFTLNIPGPSGRIRRVETIETEVAVNPDPAFSEIKVTPGQAAGRYDLVIIPRDRFGNYVGPGYEDRVKVKLDGGGTAGTATDANVKGDYVVRLDGIPAGADPVVHISVAEKEIVKAPFSKVAKIGPPGNTVSCSCPPKAGTSTTALDPPQEVLLGGVVLLGACGMRKRRRRRLDD
ncbi:VWA domain-containing protein [Sorangium sp. So ce1151]|uniref:VWA domain-containing protein n=1 Tax=Sorangium sp. So ce1151 TaxID=3133332 RepID=UPI003F600D26